MSKQYPGGLITKTPVTPTSLSASGIWSLSDQAKAQATNTWPFPRDPQFNYVTMLLHGDGSAGAVPATGVGAGVSTTVTNFNADASTNNFNITINGDARSDNFTPYQGTGYYSNNFSASSTTYLSTASNAAFAFGTGDFTMEAFVFATASQTDNWIIGLESNCWFRVGSGGALEFYNSVTSTSTLASTALPLNTWTHVAVVRSGTALTIYQNGVSVGTATVSTNFSSSVACTIGNQVGNDRRWNGYISNARVVKGTAVYTAAFTPSTSPLTAITNTSLLTCQNNRFIDNSTNAFTLTVSGTPTVSPAQPFTLPTTVATYGSGYFDGTGDYLGVTGATTALAFGSGDFTIEFWGYILQTTPEQMFIDWRPAGTQTTQPLIYVTSAGVLAYYVNAANRITGATLVTGQWYHIAVSRSGTSTKMFLNGVQTGSTWTDTTVYTNTSTRPVIGLDGNTGNSGYLKGNVTDVRTLTGTALYTTTFTPPTAPLTAITNTSLLTTQYNGGGNNSGFKDSSQFNFPITRNGNTTQGTFTPYGSNWSNYLGGAGNYFQTPASSATTIVGTLSSTVNLTIECWIFPTAYNSSANFPGLIGDMVATTENNNWSWGITNTGTLMLYWNTGTQLRATSASAVSLNTWTHIALNVSAGAITMYINGVSQTLSGTTTLSTPASSNGYLVIGQWNNGSGGTGGVSNGLYTGYISNLRVVKASTYTSSFTPSTVPLTAITSTSLLYCQSNRFVDNSSNALAITLGGSPSVQRFSPFAPLTVYNPTTYGGSGYFDGASDYLRCPTGYLAGITTGSFTVEGWWNFGDFTTRTSYFQRLWSFGTGLGLDVTLNIDNSGSLVFRINDSIIISGSGALKLFSWNHVAVVRSSGTITIYVNGTSVGSASNSANLSTQAANPFYLGSESDGAGGYFFGYCSDLRVTNTAVYTAAFTPNTAPLTAITGTGLLLNTTNPAILDNSMMNNLETVGNAAVSTSVKKYGSASIAFDGSGDYLISNPSSTDLYAFNTGDFTVEFWLYLNTTSGTQIVYDCRPSGTNGTQPIIFVDSGVVKFQHSTVVRITGATLSTGTWYHIAVARSGTNTKMFVNGTQSGSTYTSDSTSYSCAANRPVVGADGSNLATNQLNGYVDDMRVTKGYARYTTAFTVPDQAFPNG